MSERDGINRSSEFPNCLATHACFVSLLSLSLSSHCLDFGKKRNVCFWNALLLATSGIKTSLESHGRKVREASEGYRVFFQMGSGVKLQRSSFTRSFIQTPVIGPPLSFIFSQIHQAWQAGNSSRRGALLQNPPTGLSLPPWEKLCPDSDCQRCWVMWVRVYRDTTTDRERPCERERWSFPLCFFYKVMSSGQTCARIYFNTQRAGRRQGRGLRFLSLFPQTPFLSPCVPAQSSVRSRRDHSGKIKQNEAKSAYTHTHYEASLSPEFDLLTRMLLSDRFPSGFDVFACCPETTLLHKSSMLWDHLVKISLSFIIYTSYLFLMEPTAVHYGIAVSTKHICAVWSKHGVWIYNI